MISIWWAIPIFIGGGIFFCLLQWGLTAWDDYLVRNLERDDH